MLKLKTLESNSKVIVNIQCLILPQEVFKYKILYIFFLLMPSILPSVQLMIKIK